MSRNKSAEQERPAYVAPRITSYTESQVAETLGPVLLSGAGSDLGVLGGDQSPTANNTGGRPRR
jgi:hypothetical protein